MTETAAMIRVELFDCIADVPAADWDRLAANGSLTQSRAFWQVIEQAGLNDFRYRHALFYGTGDRALGMASFYSVTTDVAIFAPPWLRTLLGRIRRILPGFLKVRMLECGSPLTINPPLVCAAAGCDDEIVAALDRLLLEEAGRQRAFINVVRDFQPSAARLLEAFQAHGYCAANSLPNTYIEVAWDSVEAYRAAMKSYFRSKLDRHLRRNREQGVHHRLVEDFGDLAETLCRQWLVVHHQADEYQREVLTPEFYRGFAALPGQCARALLFYRDDELVGHALLLLDGDLLRWMYFGRERAGNDSLYIYVGHAVIASAILLGAARIELGLTTYAVKRDLGARLNPVRMALKSRHRLVNPFIRHVYPLLNRTPQPADKDVFKQS
jgi:hypothetical protein